MAHSIKCSDMGIVFSETLMNRPNRRTRDGLERYPRVLRKRARESRHKPSRVIRRSRPGPRAAAAAASSRPTSWSRCESSSSAARCSCSTARRAWRRLARTHPNSVEIRVAASDLAQRLGSLSTRVVQNSPEHPRSSSYTRIDRSQNTDETGRQAAVSLQQAALAPGAGRRVVFAVRFAQAAKLLELQQAVHAATHDAASEHEAKTPPTARAAPHKAEKRAQSSASSSTNASASTKAHGAEPPAVEQSDRADDATQAAAAVASPASDDSLKKLNSQSG